MAKALSRSVSAAGSGLKHELARDRFDRFIGTKRAHAREGKFSSSIEHRELMERGKYPPLVRKRTSAFLFNRGH
jgi:hypothetical protein